MRRLLIIPIGLLLLLLGAIYFSGGTTDSKADFIFVNRGDIKTLDLSKMSYMQDIRMAYGLWEGLYTPDPVTIDPIPGCAFPIEISEDRKTYTFHIRPEARWTNGDPVVAADFLFAWKRACDSQAEYCELLNYIDGVEAYQDSFREFQKKSNSAPKPDFSKVKIETSSDPKFLRVHLKNPTTYFPDLCAFPTFFPLHAQSMAQRDDKGNILYEKNGDIKIDPSFTKPPKLVSNGPYRLHQWDFKTRLRLVASDHYWNKQAVQSRVLDMLTFDDQQNAFTAYENGAVDWLAEVQDDFAAELYALKRTDLKVFPGFGTYFYSFMCREKLPDGSSNPLHDVRVRKALSMSVKKDYIVDYITRMGEKPAGSFIPQGVFPGYASPDGLPYDVAKAKALLADAGYPDGQGFPRLKINFNTELPRHKDIAVYMQRQWKESLNIDMVLDGKEVKSFGDQLSKKNYAVSRASWYGDYNDPTTFTDKYLPENGNNDSDWRNAKYAALCEQANGLPPPGVTDAVKWRLDLFHQAEKIMIEEAPILPLFSYMNTYLFHEGVTGLPLSSRQMMMLHALKSDHNKRKSNVSKPASTLPTVKSN